MSGRAAPPESLPPGSYDGIVIGCEWTPQRGLAFDITVVAGAHKGDVLSLTVPADAVPEVVRRFGLRTGGLDPLADIVGLPCDVVVEQGRIGLR